MRSEINPCGYDIYEFVSKANLMVSRNLGLSFHITYLMLIIMMTFLVS